MSYKSFWFFLGLIILSSFAVHTAVLKNNNLFFTVDQGRDAVYVREILENKRIFLKGPETSIRGIFTGPLWYYFVAVGYFFSGGHPVGGVWILILLNLAATIVLVLVIARRTKKATALVVGAGLSFFWPFFKLSLWSFNPFPTGALAIILILLLTKALEGRKKFYFWGAIPIFFAFNANLASAGALTTFYLLIGLWLVIKREQTKVNFEKTFVLLTLGLLAVSLPLTLSAHYRDWHTVYLPPLVFVSLLLMIMQLPKKLSFPILVFTLIFNFLYFGKKYQEYKARSTNPSVLYNQLAVVDWIYEDAKALGFKVYNYTDTFYDYPYQYLFWWYGLKNYGYLPDEYSNFPLSHKGLYIPGYEHYLTPSRSGLGTKYLIIQSGTNGEKNRDWPEKFKQFHRLVGEMQFGDIRVEKYQPVPGYPNDYCIWWDQCNP